MQNLYSAFHDWRVRLLQDLQRVELETLRTLRGDLVRTVEHIDAEIARRNHDRSEPERK